jgi:hypothetical protein
MGATTKNFTIQCKGLKPNTIHQFFYEGIDNTSLCLSDMPTEKNTTVLKTDATGTINFRFALSVDQSQKTGWYNWRRRTEYWLDISGTKKFELRAINSTATKTVLFADT